MTLQYQRLMRDAAATTAGEVDRAWRDYSQHAPKPPPVKVRALVPFFAGGGRLLEVGDVAALAADVAEGMIALKRAEKVS